MASPILGIDQPHVAGIWLESSLAEKNLVNPGRQQVKSETEVWH